MKLKVTFKDPDVVYDAITDAVATEIQAMDNLEEDEAELIEESRREKLNVQLRTWIKYGEYVSIEFDTEAKTATVLPAS